jgi:hypothetical protein
MNEETVEQEARRLRDVIYGKDPLVTDGRWECMVDKWIADIAWLRRQAAKEGMSGTISKRPQKTQKTNG